MALTIPSDRLSDLRELFLGWAAFYREVEIRPQISLVIDTNAVLQDILFIVKSQKNRSSRTDLQEVIDSGAVVALAPFKLREEVIVKIPILAAKEKVSEEALLRAWVEYRPRIRFLDEGAISAEEEAAAVDPDDLPFVRLYLKVDADAVVRVVFQKLLLSYNPVFFNITRAAHY